MTLPWHGQLLADLAALADDHSIDAGLLGEYAQVARQQGPGPAGEAYPRVAAHVRSGCRRCEDFLATLEALARRASPWERGHPFASLEGKPGSPRCGLEARAPREVAEPLEIAEAAALARIVEAEREALRAPLRPDRAGQVDSRRLGARRRQLLLVEAALIRQRLVARRLFLERALAPQTRRPANPKAGLLLDDFAGQVDQLGRLAGRLARLTADLRRLGDDPRGPARSQADTLTDRGLTLTRDGLAIDRRLARLQGPLAGMVT